jgi:hypothetical protein
MGFVAGETGCCSEACVKCDVGGCEEGSIKVEQSIDINDEIAEGVTSPSMRTQHEVRQSLREETFRKL